MLVPSSFPLIIGKTIFIFKEAIENFTWSLFKEHTSFFLVNIYSTEHRFTGKGSSPVDAYGNSLYNNSIDCTHIMVI